MVLLLRQKYKWTVKKKTLEKKLDVDLDFSKNESVGMYGVAIPTIEMEQENEKE